METLSVSNVDLSAYSSGDFSPGASYVVRSAWFLLDATILQARWIPGSVVRRALLRLFGATIGRRVVLRPGVHIKAPWRLKIGDHTWVGERAWIDNLVSVSIGSNVCVSQDAYILTGNHDYTRSDFRLRTAPVTLEDGVWIGARAIVCPGVTVARDCVVAVGSVATRSTEPSGIYQGNPATRKKDRVIR